VSVLAALTTQQSYIALLPVVLLVVYATAINFKLMYYVLLASIPLAMEYSFSSSLGTDLPDEPLMIGLMLVTIVYLLRKPQALPTGFFAHPLILVLTLHLVWILMAAINSVNTLVSYKVFAGKIWYVTAFTVLTAVIIRDVNDVKRIFWVMFIPLTFAVTTVLVRFAPYHFAFDEVNKPMWPFFRNHVSFAAITAVFLPFIILARTWYTKGSYMRLALTLAIVYYIAAIYISYTRTCYLAVFLLIPVYMVVRLKLMRYVLLLGLVGSVFFINNLFKENKYLRYAPRYEDAIMHDEFNEHLASTFEGKDVSSMERVYRWVAAEHMFQARPVLGFGPGNFYPYYKDYAVSSFRTYVSDNPERSTTHNYFLLLATEQGAVGLAIFVILTLVIFIYGETIYHRMINEREKHVVMTLLLVLSVIYVNLLLNDLLESDKVGPFFFMCIALLASFDIRNRIALKKGTEEVA
jgi:O-antigen ligase